ncbi:hypothetical protein AT6N2_C0073 [Agrobacterium tumefaciens]|nr:hypothetical protein AT6N2_C0073 [Agrobacterium tumefaciens]
MRQARSGRGYRRATCHSWRVHPVLGTQPLARLRRIDDRDKDAGHRTKAHMPGRADKVIGHRRANSARQHHRIKILPLAEAEDHTHEIDRQQHIKTDGVRVPDEVAERCADNGHDNPQQVNRGREAHIPGEIHSAGILVFPHGFGELRIDKDKEAGSLLQKRPVRDHSGNGGRIEDVAEIDREDRKNDQPGRNLLAEKFDTHELARAGINGAAHDRGFGDAEAVVGGDCAEQCAEGGGGEGDREPAPQPLAEI